MRSALYRLFGNFSPSLSILVLPSSSFRGPRVGDVREPRLPPADAPRAGCIRIRWRADTRWWISAQLLPTGADRSCLRAPSHDSETVCVYAASRLVVRAQATACQDGRPCILTAASRCTQ